MGNKVNRVALGDFDTQWTSELFPILRMDFLDFQLPKLFGYTRLIWIVRLCWVICLPVWCYLALVEAPSFGLAPAGSS